MLVEGLAHLLELSVVQVEHVGAPGAAEFDEPDAQLVEYRALLLEVR